MIENIQSLPLSSLANSIQADYRSQGKKPYFGAVPYLQAMATMNDIKENYGLDSGKSIVAYLLSNLTTWRGETARQVKTELNHRLKTL